MKIARIFLIVFNVFMSFVNIWFFCKLHHTMNLIAAVLGVIVAALLFLTGKAIGEY